MMTRRRLARDAAVLGVAGGLGEGVSSVSVGDRVMAMPNGAAFAEYSIARTSSVFPMPKAMSFEEAAALPIVYHTSYFALQHRTILRAAEWLLVHAGASGVGMSAIQIGNALGAKRI